MANFLTSDSRFINTPKINFDGKQTFGMWKPPSYVFNSDIKYAQYDVPAAFAGRPDLISYSLYRTPIYWWSIVALNAPRDTLSWPKSGDTIKVLNITTILSEQ